MGLNPPWDFLSFLGRLLGLGWEEVDGLGDHVLLLRNVLVHSKYVILG